MTENPTPGVVDQIEFTRWLEQLRVTMTETVGGVLLRGARPVAVGTGGTARPTTSAAALIGFAIRETTGAAGATVLLREHDAAGDVIVPIKLGNGECRSEWFGPGGINVQAGLYVDVVAGAIDGSVFLRGTD